MDIDQALQAFIDESRELLADMEKALLNLRQAEAQAEQINAIFRAAHTIKGSAGLFGLDAIVAFTHVVESVLDRVRAGRLSIDESLLALLLSCGDHISALVAVAEDGQPFEEPGLVAAGSELASALRAYLVEPVEQVTPVAVTDPDADRVQRIGATQADADNWHISLRLGADVLRCGLDPIAFIRYLETIGKIVGIVVLADSLPPVAEMDPESCYLGFEIALSSDADKATIENVFEFIRDDATIRILPPNSRISEYVDLIRNLPGNPNRLGEMLVTCGTVTANELDAALKLQASTENGQPLGQILIEEGMVQPAVVEAALAKQQQIKEARIQESRSVRVDADKLDRLVDLVGELIIACASANLVARRTNNAELQESNSKLSALVSEVRDSALQLRMVKIGATFSRFQRVVHDVSKEIGKDIELSVSGEDTELDKTVVEKIADPLTHLVRNAIDHGIEPAHVRAQLGKPARGQVSLNAYHDSGCIVIEVKDDGGGLKRDKILAKAMERGLVEPGKNLSEQEIFNLIFEPGFSTADQITNLSGRGVGMDVVKRNITSLRGTVDIFSVEGEGTAVTVRLPLTLAIINGFLVEVGKSIFVIPLDMVEECIEYGAEQDRDYTDLRGEVLPFVRLAKLFTIERAPTRRQNIVVIKHAGQRAGVVVDTLLGEFQTVIKPLSKLFNQVRCVSGSTILGSGDVALILDVPALVQMAASTETRMLSAEAM